MTEDEMYDIIRGYEDSERDYHERNIELEVENAKLRSELESVGTAAYLYGRGDLQAENAKLRKLLSCALISAGYDGRRFLDAYLQEEEGTTLLQELRSLGIEVEP